MVHRCGKISSLLLLLAISWGAPCRAEPIPIPSGYHQGSMGGFLTFDEVVADLELLHATYPDLVSAPVSIGTSWEGRDIWMVKLSDNPEVDEPEPEVLYDSLTHAREAATCMVLHFFMWHLVEQYGVDPAVTDVLDNRELYFVPVVNPDGYVYNQTTDPDGGGLWRKNMRDNGDGTFGVDLNRNFDSMWGCDDIGSSPDPSKNTYRGPYAFSEPESEALRQLAIDHEFRIAIHLHSKGGELLHPFGYTPSAYPMPPEWGTYTVLIDWITAETGYPHGNTIQATSNFSNGRAGDWFLGEMIEKPPIIAFTPEVGEDTWWPDEATTLALAQEYAALCMTVAQALPTYVGGVVTDPEGEPIQDARITVVEYGIEVVTGDDGSFLVLLPEEGTATLLASRYGFEDDIASVVVDELGSAVLDVLMVMEPLSMTSLEVTLVDAETGDPLEGILVETKSDPPLLQVTDPSGVAWFPSFPAVPVKLYVHSWGHQPAIVGVSPTEGVPEVLALALEPAVVTWDFEEDGGWLVSGTVASAKEGPWIREVPVPSYWEVELAAPAADHTPDPAGEAAFITGYWYAVQNAGIRDLDAGVTILESPPYDTSGLAEPAVSFYRWFVTSDPGGADTFSVLVEHDGSGTWTTLSETASSSSAWELVILSLAASDEAPPSSVKLRFVVEDGGEETIVEGGLDDLQVFDAAGLPESPCVVTSDDDTTCDGVDDDCDGITDDEATCGVYVDDVVEETADVLEDTVEVVEATIDVVEVSETADGVTDTTGEVADAVDEADDSGAEVHEIMQETELVDASTPDVPEQAEIVLEGLVEETAPDGIDTAHDDTTEVLLPEVSEDLDTDDVVPDADEPVEITPSGEVDEPLETADDSSASIDEKGASSSDDDGCSMGSHGAGKGPAFALVFLLLLFVLRRWSSLSR